MKWSAYLPTAALAVLFAAGCQTVKNPVPYREIYKVEVSSEKSGFLTFRIDYRFNSFCGIGAYRLDQKPSEKGRDIYFSIARAERKAEGITESLDRGVEILVPFKCFDESRDACWYVDESGRYPIPIGTRQTWDAYFLSATNAPWR